MDPSIIVTNKPVHFAVLTDSFIIFSVTLLKPHKTAKCTLTGLKAKKLQEVQEKVPWPQLFKCWLAKSTG